jgi:hypothetical protein
VQVASIPALHRRAAGTGPRFIRISPGNRRGRVLYRRSDVELWLASRTRPSTSDHGGRAA